MTALDLARKRIESALSELAPLFKAHKLTFVARCTDPALGDADVIVTSEEDLFVVARVLEDHGHRQAPYVCPGCFTVGGGPCAPGCIDAEREEREELEQDRWGWDDDSEEAWAEGDR